MNRKAPALSFVLFVSLFCMNATAQVEYVFYSIVTDEATLIEAYDAWFSSDDAKHGQIATLLASVINGESTATHTTVLDFPDYASLQSAMNKIVNSDDFTKLERRTSGISTGGGEGMYLRVMDNGKSWKEGDYLYAVGVEVSAGADDAYAMAFEEFINSEMGKQAPGLLRLLATRAGANVSHHVLVSAPTFVGLNEYMDTSGESEAFDNFMSKVKEISTPIDPSIYSVVKVWK